jgi:tRNA A37 N6-isopentenylltransferase MiaA
VESAVEQMKLDTLHYAKRQWTWWRGQKNTIWLNGFGFEEGVIAERSSRKFIESGHELLDLAICRFGSRCLLLQ